MEAQDIDIAKKYNMARGLVNATARGKTPDDGCICLRLAGIRLIASYCGAACILVKQASFCKEQDKTLVFVIQMDEFSINGNTRCETCAIQGED